MDLSTLKTKDVETLHVKGPDGKETDITIDLYSSDSEVYDEAMAEWRDKLLGKKREKDEKVSVKESYELNAMKLARCTKGWSGLAYNGEELEFSFENAKMIYNEPGLRWLHDQVNNFITSRENYLGN